MDVFNGYDVMLCLLCHMMRICTDYVAIPLLLHYSIIICADDVATPRLPRRMRKRHVLFNTPSIRAPLLSFRRVDVVVSLERRVMLDTKQRKRQVGHELKSFAFWCVHSPLVSFFLVLAQ